MSEMVERVSSAILRKVPTGYGMTKEEADGYARAAIEAMREPTPAMVSAGEWREGGIDSPELIWQDMIDEALKEDRPE